MTIEEVFQVVAKNNGMTPEQVRAHIQEMITDAYTNPRNDNKVTKSYQRRVSCKGEIPTPEELVRYLADQIK